MGKRELVASLGLSAWCLVIVVWLFLAVPLVCVQFVIVVFPDHTRLLFLPFLLYWKPESGYLAGSDDPRKMSQNVAFHQVLYC